VALAHWGLSRQKQAKAAIIEKREDEEKFRTF